MTLAVEASEEIATRLVGAVRSAFDTLQAFPHAGVAREQLVPGLRVTFRGLYAIYYRPFADRIIIMRVIHGARDIVVIGERALADQAAWLRGVPHQVDLYADRLEVHLDAKRLLAALDTGVPVSVSAEAEPAPLISLFVLARLRRAGRDMALVIEAGDSPQWVDSALARLIARAHTLHGALLKGDVPSIAALAAREKVGGPYMPRLLRLAYLAPDIIEAILTRRSALTFNRLMKQLHLPLDWISQRRALGLG